MLETKEMRTPSEEVMDLHGGYIVARYTGVTQSMGDEWIDQTADLLEKIVSAICCWLAR